MSDLVEIFKTFGWPGLLMVAVIIALYIVVLYLQKKTEDKINTGFDSLARSITEQNSQLVNAITDMNKQTHNQLFDLMSQSISVSLAKHDTDVRKTHSESINRRFEISSEINDMLWDLMNFYNAQRCVLIEFHNSKENLNGLSFLWYDIQYEKQQKGIPCISSKYKNIQASGLTPIIDMVNESSSNIVILDEEDIDNIYERSTVLYSQLKDRDVNHMIYCGVYSDNNLVGLIALEYISGYPYHEDVINLFDIKEKAATIGLLLNFVADDKHGSKQDK